MNEQSHVINSLCMCHVGLWTPSWVKCISVSKGELAVHTGIHMPPVSISNQRSRYLMIMERSRLHSLLYFLQILARILNRLAFHKAAVKLGYLIIYKQILFSFLFISFSASAHCTHSILRLLPFVCVCVRVWYQYSWGSGSRWCWSWSVSLQCGLQPEDRLAACKCH